MATEIKLDEKVQNAPIMIEHVPSANESTVDDGFRWNLNVIFNLVSLYITSLACTWMLFSLAISLPYINATFPGEADVSSWIAAVAGLAQCVVSLFIGELSDIFDRRWFIVIGNLLIMVGTLVSSRATSVSMIIGGQVISGIGISLGFLAIPALAEIVPKRSRSYIIAIATGANGSLAAVGAVAIGGFTKLDVGEFNQGWRMGAYLGTAFSFIALLLTFFFFHPSPRLKPQGMQTSKRLQMIDWFGIFIGITALTLILLALHFGGSRFAWNSVQVLCLLLVGVGCLIVFIVWEVYVPFGLFPKSLFEHRNYPIMLATQFVEGMAFNTPAPFLTRMGFILFTTDPLMVQVRNLSFTLAPILGAAIAAGIMYWTKETKWVTIGTVALALLATGLLSIIEPNSNYAIWFFPTLFLGCSVAGMGVCVTVIASLCTPNQLIATAVSLCTSVRGLGAAVGIIIFDQVYQSKLREFEPREIAAAAVEAGLPESSVTLLVPAVISGNQTALASIPGLTPAIGEAVENSVKLAHAKSFSFMWYSLLPFVGVTLICTLFLKFTKNITTTEVASRVQERHVGRERESAKEDSAPIASA